MERYNKYLVLKNTDINESLSVDELSQLEDICNKVSAHRAMQGKHNKKYVVVSEDWPMYEDTWKAIEKYVDSTQPTNKE